VTEKTVPDRLQQARQLAAAGRLAEARLLVESICRENPEYADAWLLLGSLHGHLGEFPQAEQCLRQGLSLQPQNAAGHYQLAAALKAQGKPGEAIRHYRQTVQLQPGLARAHNDLGVTLQEQGQLDKATACYEEAIRLQPDYTMAHYNLGSVKKAQGNYNAAEYHYRQALASKNDFVAAHLALGLVQQAQENPTGAVTHYRQALRIDPSSDEAYYKLGKILQNLKKSDEALTALHKAVELNAGRPEAWHALGSIYRFKNDLDQAMSCFQKACDLKPGYGDAIQGQLDILGLRGDFESAFGLISPVIEAGSDHIGIALCFASLSKRFDCKEAALELLQRAEKKQGLQKAERMQLHFALGKLNDSIGNYDDAFRHYQQGNALKDTDFIAAEHTAFFDSLIATFSPERMPYLPRSTVETNVPVFIVGMPRSGTTLVEQIIASHPQAYGAGELTQITDLSANLPGRLHTDTPYPNCMPLITRDIVDQSAHSYLEQLPEAARGALRVTDKLPHNFLHLGLIELLFPRARIIHCQRDPRDNCLSIYFCDFYSEHNYAYDLSSIGQYYLEYQRLMHHWKTSLSLPIYTIQYEDLVADQENISRGLLEFCGLDWDSRCLVFHRNKRVVRTASYEQVRNPMYNRSAGRWLHYKKYLTPLFEALAGDRQNKG
jgi:tetratricopeptide (TPR) repeat protein